MVSGEVELIYDTTTTDIDYNASCVTLRRLHSGEFIGMEDFFKK